MQRHNATAEGIVVDCPSGRLAGLRTDGIFEFRGIPFAVPPVGKRRWAMPESAQPWAGLRDATRFGPVCPQAPSPFDALLGGSLASQSEDCLYLNVWTPEIKGPALPVMVWLHGGAFVIGAGSQSIYAGTHLAKRGVVVVTINYRLGIFGFLDLTHTATGAAGATGVEGLADQVLALYWVRRNIAAFGGDPDNVTVFGESAGAMSIAALLASSCAKGLFRRAILQSGSAFVGHTSDRSERLASAVLEALAIAPADAGALMELPTAALLKAQLAVIAAAHDGHDRHRLGRLPFQPSIGGPFLPLRPIAAIRGHSAVGTSLLCGTAQEEWKLFTAADPRTRFMPAAAFEERLARTAGAAAASLRDAYSAGSPFERFNTFMTDRLFGVPAVRLLDAQSRAARAYAYRFDWKSRLLGGVFGACHALELGFVFGTHASGPASVFFGKGTAAEALASGMMDAWSAFARAGDPSCAALGPWPAYDPRERATMIFGDGKPHIVNGPDRVRIDAWNSVAESRLEP